MCTDSQRDTLDFLKCLSTYFIKTSESAKKELCQTIFRNIFSKTPKIFFFIFNFFIDSLEVSHHEPQFCSLPSSPLSSYHPRHAPYQRKQIKVSNQVNKNKNKTKPHQQKNLFAFPSCFSNTSSFLLVAMEVSVCHTVYLFVPSVFTGKWLLQ